MDITRTLIRKIKKKSKTGRETHVCVFSYKNNNNKCTTKEIDRIKKLNIPPIWKDVNISNSELSYLQVTGKDEKDRTQYIYHPMWILLTNNEKYDRMGKFSKKIGFLEKQIKVDICSVDKIKQRIAIMFLILKKTHIRVGNECYAKDNNTYGLTTLKGKHLRIKGKCIIFNFVGKKGVKQNISFSDSNCLIYFKNMGKITSETELFPLITPIILKNYLADIMGSEFTCKDFRTYASNILFLKILCKYPIANTKKEKKHNLKETYDKVADKLGHTRAISKKSYVMGIIPEQYELNPSQFSNKNPTELFRRFITFSGRI